jgi:hypothetical protein
MLSFLYSDNAGRAPSGFVLDGLSGAESNPAPDGSAVTVRPIATSDPNAYPSPGADPGEGFAATNAQLFGSGPAVGTPTNAGFVTNYAITLAWEAKDPSWSVLPGTATSWRCARPRPFPCSPRSRGALPSAISGSLRCRPRNSRTAPLPAPPRARATWTTSGAASRRRASLGCSAHNIAWTIYGYDSPPLTRQTFTDITSAAESHFGLFSDFEAAAAAGSLVAYSFVEPSWESTNGFGWLSPTSLHLANFSCNPTGKGLSSDIASPTDGGLTWVPDLLPADVPQPEFSGLACPSDNECWVSDSEAVRSESLTFSSGADGSGVSGKSAAAPSGRDSPGVVMWMLYPGRAGGYAWTDSPGSKAARSSR